MRFNFAGCIFNDMPEENHNIFRFERRYIGFRAEAHDRRCVFTRIWSNNIIKCYLIGHKYNLMVC